MAENNQESRVSLDSQAHTQEGMTSGSDFLKFLVANLPYVVGNPTLQGEVLQQLQDHGIIPKDHEERVPEGPHVGEISKKGTSTGKREHVHVDSCLPLGHETPHKSGGNLPTSEEPSLKEDHENESPSQDMAPRRKRSQRSRSPFKRRREKLQEKKREEKTIFFSLFFFLSFILFK